MQTELNQHDIKGAYRVGQLHTRSFYNPASFGSNSTKKSVRRLRYSLVTPSLPSCLFLCPSSSPSSHIHAPYGFWSPSQDYVSNGAMPGRSGRRAGKCSRWTGATEGSLFVFRSIKRLCADAGSVHLEDFQTKSGLLHKSMRKIDGAATPCLGSTNAQRDRCPSEAQRPGCQSAPVEVYDATVGALPSEFYVPSINSVQLG